MMLSRFAFLTLCLLVSLSILCVSPPAALAQSSIPPEKVREKVVSSLQHQFREIKTLKASAMIGVPHPESPIVHWSNSLIAFRVEPEYLYLKGYKPLIPLYFLLTSRAGRFKLFFPRYYTVYSGANKLFEEDPDVELRLIAQDIIAALRPVRIREEDKLEWDWSETAQKLTVKKQAGNARREFLFDQDFNAYEIKKVNEAGFPSVVITKSDWRKVAGVPMPFEIKIKRFVPQPNDLIFRFQEIRLNPQLEPEILDYKFPEDATYVELKPSE